MTLAGAHEIDRGAPAGASRRRRRCRRIARVAADYVALTKPRIIELLLVTTVPTMLLAADGRPGVWCSSAPPWSAAPWRPARPTSSTATSTATSTR